LLLFLLCLPGCGGCRKTPQSDEQEKQQAEEKAKKKEREKEPFEARSPVVMPPGAHVTGYCKPGHWISQVWPDVIANRGDFQGELHTEVATADNRRTPLVAVPYELTTQRPAVLAKEQAKSLTSYTWIPPRDDARAVNFKLVMGGGPAAIEQFMPLLRMPSYQYYFVVLSQAVGRYEYLGKKLASIHPGHATADADVGPKFYEVVTVSSRRPSLPNHALYWTSIAYLLWDDFDPAQCDLDQQKALVDWLHWGGQIIVSGPDALEQLHNSFLQRYLPATAEKSRSLAATDVTDLKYWDVEKSESPELVKPWSAAELKKDPSARYLPNTGNFLVERQIGRGRIVASAFRLSGPELTAWKGYDSLFNACLLRRPARNFFKDQDPGDNRFSWVGSPASPRLDAAKMTALRYFVRDTGVAFEKYAPDIAQIIAERSRSKPGVFPRLAANDNPIGSSASNIPPDDSDPIPFDKEVAPGLGAWNDFNPVANAARATLLNAAGINVPPRSFIVWVVVGYLCVLVPVNCIIFQLLGRVEWAWIAAPLIAIACTVVVIQQAQLNIGFARSRNEIAVVEMQAGYSRAHVTRYTALYTSLTTPYEFHLDDPGGQILPFPRVDSPEDFKMPIWQVRSELVCRRGDDTQLSGFRVGSNVTDFMHTEEMADFGGVVTLHGDSNGNLRVTNNTAHPLDDCRAVRGGIDLATIGRLEPGATAALNFTDRIPALASSHQAPGRPGELSVEGIKEVALTAQALRPDEICLVAKIADEVPGLTITPDARQSRQAALLVAHLHAGRLPDPERDVK
jgi:hypothetical protein